MTERIPAPESVPPPVATAPQPVSIADASRTAAAVSGVIIGAGQAEIAAEAVAADQQAPPGATITKLNGERPGVRRPRRTFRRPATYPPGVPSSPPAASSAPASQETLSTDALATGQTTPDTQSELRNWIKDNATLLSNASLLISIAALALNLLPDTGLLDPYIKALIFGAALLLLIELHYQWPDDLQLHMFRPTSLPQRHSWRMVAFAITMQLATVVFAVWATLNTPIVLIPLTALGVVVAFRQWYFRRFRGFAARSFGIVALVAALLLSELLMVIVWALIAGENVTIELWANERPGFTVVTSSDP